MIELRRGHSDILHSLASSSGKVFLPGNDMVHMHLTRPFH
jgi:hypothetical protein